MANRKSDNLSNLSNLSTYLHLETVYHRYFAGERSKVLSELWSTKGTQTFSTFQRSTLFNSLRCGQMLMPNIPGQPEEPVLSVSLSICLSVLCVCVCVCQSVCLLCVCVCLSVRLSFSSFFVIFPFLHVRLSIDHSILADLLFIFYRFFGPVSFV